MASATGHKTVDGDKININMETYKLIIYIYIYIFISFQCRLKHMLLDIQADSTRKCGYKLSDTQLLIHVERVTPPGCNKI